MIYKVMLFAQLKDIMGQSSLSLDLEEAVVSVEQLLQQVIHKYPQLTEHVHTLRVAINHEYVELTEDVKSQDEIAFIPPVSGG